MADAVVQGKRYFRSKPKSGTIVRVTKAFIRGNAISTMLAI